VSGRHPLEDILVEAAGSELGLHRGARWRNRLSRTASVRAGQVQRLFDHAGLLKVLPFVVVAPE
jgi:hypothetical protein